MTAATTWPARAETWLDERGTWAWVAAMVLGFILFWPIGLAILAYMIWGKHMFRSSRSGGCAWRKTTCRDATRPSGNTAFDAYKTDTLKRLEEEQKAFDDFLRRLREAKDKTEFDAFMDERARQRRDEATAEG